MLSSCAWRREQPQRGGYLGLGRRGIRGIGTCRRAGARLYAAPLPPPSLFATPRPVQGLRCNRQRDLHAEPRPSCCAFSFAASVPPTVRCASLQAPSISEVTAIEYNRFIVEEANKKDAEERKQDHDKERNYRKELEERYQQFGRDHLNEFKGQMETAKREVDNLHNANSEKGRYVKDEVEALRKARKAQQEQWVAHGSALTQEYGSEQKRRIKQQIGATTSRKKEAAAILRKEMGELEKARTERRNQAVENRRQLKERIDSQTNDAATQEAKDTFFQQRKASGDDTRESMKAWKTDRVKQQGQHLDKAAAAREQALQAKKAAKEALEGVKEARALAAKEMRQRKSNIAATGGTIKNEVKHNKKIVHDMMRNQKFVPPTQAEGLRKVKSPTPATGE